MYENGEFLICILYINTHARDKSGKRKTVDFWYT